MNLGLKDLRLAAAAAQNAERTLPLLDAVCARMGAAVEPGLAGQDWPAIADYTLRHTRL